MTKGNALLLHLNRSYDDGFNFLDYDDAGGVLAVNFRTLRGGMG